jgi:hypothetical protein
MRRPPGDRRDFIAGDPADRRFADIHDARNIPRPTPLRQQIIDLLDDPIAQLRVA